MAIKPYIPAPVPPSNLDDHLSGMSALVGRANAQLSRYDGLLEGLVNPQVLLAPLLMKEAELSSRIEGTVATAAEVYEKQAGAEFEAAKEADIVEIINYEATLQLAEEHLREHRISLHLLRAMHAHLMRGVRGEDKRPGEFRTTQNWIGPKGCAIEQATYVPPSPLQVPNLLEQFEQFLDRESTDLDPIVQAALIHAQFELIHPFDDGNGRIGRLLIPLYLHQRKSLVSPSFYVSGYLEANRDEYAERLGAISKRGDWCGWLVFFLEAVVAQSDQNIEIVHKITELYDRMKIRVAEATKSNQAMAILDALFDMPVFGASTLHRRLNLARQRAASALRALHGAGIIQEVRPSSGRRPAIHAFTELLEILSDV